MKTLPLQLFTVLVALILPFPACKTDGPTRRQETLSDEAQGVADKLFKGYVVRCEDSYFGFKDKDESTGLRELYEFKTFAPIAEQAEAPTLSQAERLNREEEMKRKNEPEPEWVGQIKLIVTANRMYNYSKGEWGKWQDWPPQIIRLYNPIELKKVDGQWVSRVSENDKETAPEILNRVFDKITCAEVPK